MQKDHNFYHKLTFIRGQKFNLIPKPTGQGDIVLLYKYPA